jgi:hypothetical protein
MIKTNLLILLLVFYSCNPEPDPQTEGTLQPVSVGEIIEHTYFSLAYSEANEGALWVFYHLTPEHING